MAYLPKNGLLTNITNKIKYYDGIILAVGIGAFLIGVLVDIFTLRLICLIIVLSSAVLVYLSLRIKSNEIYSGIGNISSFSQQQTKSDKMKKIFFDDFQPDSRGKYITEDIEEIRTNEEIITPELQTIEEQRDKKFQVLDTIKLEEKPTPKEFQISDFFDFESSIYRGELEPRTEFNYMLNKILTTAKEVFFAHSTAFFWVNREKQQIVLETKITDSNNFISTRRFPIGEDLISKIAESGKPEIITTVNPSSAHELLFYYENPANVKSFAGAPVFFSRSIESIKPNLPVGVLVIDSIVEDSFGNETLVLLGKFTQLISALIKSYTDKYDLLIESELLRSISRLREKIKSDFTQNTVVQATTEEIAKLINLDFLTIVLYDEKTQAWVAKKVINRSHTAYIITDQSIDYPNSIVGNTIKTNKSNLIGDLEQSQLPRYFTNEKIASNGSFVSVPISSYIKCYGAINLESTEKYNFSNQNLQALTAIAEQTATALEILFMNDLINEYVIIDDVTGVYSKKFFLQKVSDEIQRAEDNNAELTLLFLAIDKQNDITDRFGKDSFEKIMITLSKIIRSCVRPYDIVCRYDTNRFGILLINTAANEAYLWAEKIRKKVASHVINLEDKNFSITISIGICGLLEKMKREELLGNASAVLNKALESGGNTIRVF